jgi:hypothetical protein
MKIALLQFDNRPIPQLGAMAFLLHRNQTYAARHGYDYLFLDRVYYDLPVYWQKPKLVRHFLSTGYDMVAWLDTDAVVHDLDRRIETLFEGAEQMVAAGDNPHWDSPFNAGVFVARGAGGVAMMDRWSELFPAERWTRTETAWICDEDWAGPAYEQGAFNGRLLEGFKASGALRLVDWHVLQSPFPMDGAFTVHFAGPFKANLPAYLRLI